MAKIPKDDQVSEFHFRPGTPPFGGSGWRGVNTESDPGSLDPNELQRGENIRLKGKNITTRPGNTRVAQLATNHSVMWMAEAPSVNPRVRLWLSSTGCFGQAIGTGAQILHLDVAQNPSLQVYGNVFASSDRNILLERFGPDRLMYGDKSALREVVQLTPPPGVTTTAFSYSPPQIAIKNFPGFTILWLRETPDGVLFIGLSNDASPTTQSKVVRYNGSSFTDDLTGLRPPLAAGIWRNKLVVGFDSTAANIRVRDSGTSPVWNTFALAGFQCAAGGNAMAEGRGLLYIASDADNLFTFDGTNLVLARTVAGCSPTTGLTSVVLHEGLVHYGWNATTTLNSRIGRHDPDSTAANEFVDTYKDISADQSNFIHISAMASYKRRIVCGGRKLWLVGTAYDDIKGTIEVINNTGAPGAGFQVVQFVRFP